MPNSLKSGYVLACAEELDIKKTFECGQCFRWSADDNGVYHGAASGKALSIWREDGHIVCSAADEDISFWRNHFDLDADYATAALRFTEPEYLKVCADFGKGIRILRQEPWEALCSFIISQCNNIPRIKKIVSTLCSSFGEALPFGLRSFPAPENLAVLSEKDLAPLRSGYRAAYILNAARAICEGSLDLDALALMPSEEAFAEVKKIHGIGDKTHGTLADGQLRLLFGQQRSQIVFACIDRRTELRFLLGRQRANEAQKASQLTFAPQKLRLYRVELRGCRGGGQRIFCLGGDLT